MSKSQLKQGVGLLLLMLLLPSWWAPSHMMASAFLSSSSSSSPPLSSTPPTGFRYSTITKHLGTSQNQQNSDSLEYHDGDDDDHDAPSDIKRRLMFSDILLKTTTTATTAAVAACGVCSGFSLSSHDAAYGLAQIITAPSDLLQAYDLPRNGLQDAAFAQGMAVGMVDYEREALPKKKELFDKLFTSLQGIPEPVVVEVGMGSFPNALYYKNKKGLDIIGVDPNDRMEGFARDSASRAGLLSKRQGEDTNTLRIVHGVSEVLPLADHSADAVVCTLTLCSVLDPARSVSEIKRILKPGGKFLFWEHVLSQTDPILAQRQIEYTPNQVKRADGCHLDRKTGDVIRAAGFSQLDLEYLELKGFTFLNPTVCGIATA